MAVDAYVGLPRSGKSYTAVEQVILPALKKGRVVITNIPMKRQAVIRDYPQAEQLLREFPMNAISAQPDSIWEHCPNGSVVVLDEVWRFWPAGKKVDQIPEAFKSFLAEHGHRVDVNGDAMAIVLVTQNLGQIAAFARQQIHQTFWTTKLTSVGLTKRFRTDVYAGAPSGSSPPANQILRQIFGKYEKRVYQYYVSHTMSEASGEGGANESSVDKRGNVLLKPTIMLTPVAIIALVWFGWTHLHRVTKSPAGAPANGGAGSGAPGGELFAGISGGNQVPQQGAVRGAASTWWTSAVVRGHPTLGNYATVTNGERTVYVPLSACRVSRFDVSCPEGGTFWSSHGGASGVANKPAVEPAQASSKVGGSGRS